MNKNWDFNTTENDLFENNEISFLLLNIQLICYDEVPYIDAFANTGHQYDDVVSSMTPNEDDKQTTHGTY